MRGSGHRCTGAEAAAILVRTPRACQWLTPPTPEPLAQARDGSASRDPEVPAVDRAAEAPVSLPAPVSPSTPMLRAPVP